MSSCLKRNNRRINLSNTCHVRVGLTVLQIRVNLIKPKVSRILPAVKPRVGTVGMRKVGPETMLTTFSNSRRQS